jgi:hypothetical protein
MRLMSGISDELSDETIEKLGTEMYPTINRPLNTSPGDGSDGDLFGNGSAMPDEGSAPGPDMDGSASGYNLFGSSPGCEDMNDDGVFKDASKPYGNVTYADPGYQADKTKRYPLDTEAHIRAAWSYINMPKNAGKYSSSQVSSIKGRIRSAMQRIGAKVSKEDQALLDALDAHESVIERVRKAMRRRTTKDSDPFDGSDSPDTDDPDEPDDDTVEKGGTVGDSVPVPIKKEDGSWDLSGVPVEARPFYESMIVEKAAALEKAEQTATELAEVKDQLRSNEILKSAEAQFSSVGPTADIVEILKAADAMPTEAREALERVLSAANERIDKAALFSEIGRNGVPDGSATDAWATIEKGADALVEKSSEPITKAQATDRYLRTTDGAAAYSRYLAESGIGVS